MYRIYPVCLLCRPVKWGQVYALTHSGRAEQCTARTGAVYLGWHNIVQWQLYMLETKTKGDGSCMPRELGQWEMLYCVVHIYGMFKIIMYACIMNAHRKECLLISHCDHAEYGWLQNAHALTLQRSFSFLFVNYVFQSGKHIVPYEEEYFIQVIMEWRPDDMIHVDFESSTTAYQIKTLGINISWNNCLLFLVRLTSLPGFKKITKMLWSTKWYTCILMNNTDTITLSWHNWM